MRFIWPAGETLHAPPCPVCAAPGPHPVLLRTEEPDSTLLRCTTCRALAFAGAIPPDYAEDKPADLFVQFYVEQNAGLHHMTRLLYRLDPAAHPIDSLLDVGCGFGFPVDAAARVLGWRATGIDPSFYADIGRTTLGADIRRAYLTDQTKLGAPFDLVMGVEVIEHIPDLYPFLALLRRHLVPGGVLMLTTPDAAGIHPSVSEDALKPVLTVGAHLILFTDTAIKHALHRAGFQHVVTEIENENMVVFASDRPIVFRADAVAAHHAGHTAYLQRLLDTTAPGSTVWNGAASRLLAGIVDAAPVDEVLALYHRIALAWRDTYGIDLLRLRLPPVQDERAYAVGGPSLVDTLRAQAPVPLGAVLYRRAVLERRLPGHTPERVLAYARPAALHAGQMYRALADYGLIDFTLQAVTWHARLLIVDRLTELAPELEPQLLAGWAAASPGALAGRLDPPRSVVVQRTAHVFNRLVHTTAYDEALRLAPALDDLDTVCSALATQPLVLFHALFCLGVLRLNRLRALPAAHAAFARMQAEATARQDGPDAASARHYRGVAEEHVRLVGASQ